MNRVDRYLQMCRIKAALRWVPPGSRVLDVGCADGALFRIGRSRIESGVGIDPEGVSCWIDGSASSAPTVGGSANGPYELRVGTFPDFVNAGETFDAAVMLAVVEHVSESELKHWANAVPEMLRPSGRLIITVPSALVDHILAVGKLLRILHGMEVHQHHGFDPRQVPGIFSGQMRMIRSRRFELGLNHLFVFAAPVYAGTV